MSRVTRAYVTAYDRTRVHESRLVRGELRCLVADYNGAIPTSRTIASATWRCTQPWSGIMANCRIITGNRKTAVDLTAGYGGAAMIKCDAVMDNGENYIQLFRVTVRDAPWYFGETAPPSGPYVLTATAAV